MNANHLYRIIWSEVHDAWIAVAEITRTRGKRQAVRLALPLALLSANALADDTPTTVVPTGGNTSAYHSANGVPVVNINTANAAGLSHNQYTRYNVESNGLVLNNGNATQIQRASQLAGSVLANPNLATEARVILNEVVSTNRSTLAGFTEVVGSKADVVVANPNGITCSGCGFINTDRTTLTTGTPQINGGGSLTGFAVDRGDILIQDDGLNASAQQILDLVARSIRVDAPVNVGGSLQLVAGPNTWSYDTRGVTGSVGGSGSVPSYAVDSTALGGMYAGRIRLIATEAGVGVRMLGEAAASADDFNIDAAGQILVQTTLSAQRNMTVTATASGADITFAGDGTEVSMGGDLTISTAAGGGGSIDNEGLLLSGGTLTVTADNAITNTGTNAAMSAPSGELTLVATTGDIDNTGGAWLYSGTQLTAHADSGTFTNASTGIMWSDGGMTLSADIFVNNNWVQAAGDIAITTTTRFSNEFEGARTLGKLDDETTAAYSGYSSFPDTMQAGHWYTVYYDNVHVNYANMTAAQKFDRNVASYSEHPVAMVAGHDLSIDAEAGTFNNTGAVLSAGNNLSLSGTGSASNDALYLDTNQYQKRWAYHNYSYGLDEYNFYAATTDEQFEAGYPYYAAGSDDVTWPNPNWTFVGHVEDSTAAYWAHWYQAQADAKWYLLGQVAGQTRTIRDAVVHAGSTITVTGVNLANNGSRLQGSPGGYGHTDDARASVPTNPNGYFVPAGESSARYLIETNPRYGLGSDYAGSDYLLKSLGIDPEGTGKRLGDANYEAYLIRQQLISQTGSSVLNGYATEVSQMERLMDQAAGESKSLGLTIGTALTADQINHLNQDIVWMVETTVGGQKVLQPVVYLAAESRKLIVTGAVIAGREINMNVASLENTGGTITASQALTVTSQGDITNTSGAIKGADVSLESTQGSIVNRTFAQGRGDLTSDYRTTIGKTATIEATGSLTLDANKDIGIYGATVKATGDASLTAGGKVTVDTIVDKTTTKTTSSGSTGFLTKTGPTTTTTTTEKNIGSTIDIGGTLTLKSGGDTTLAGTQANIGGDLNVDAGGDFNILSRQDKTTTHSESTTTGFAVGGGLWGTEKTTVDDFTGKNFGSSISVGGQADIDATGDMTLRGSSLDIGKSATIDTRSVTIEQGLDEKHTVTRTETTTFLSSGSNKGSEAAADASAESGNAAASANASASASASENSEFNLMEKRTTTVDHTKTTGVASRLTTGDDLTITTRDSLTVQGSNVEAGQALSIDASRIAILAGENNEKTTTTTDTTKIGIYTDSKAEATAQAGASATGMSATAQAGASAEASADSTVTIGTRVESSTDETTSLTHSSSSLKSGAAMTLKASEEAKFVGAKVQSGGDLTIEAKDITNLAAEDKTTTTRNKTTRTTGIYLEGNASAEAKGSVSAGPGNVSATGGLSVSGEASAGLHYNQNTQASEQGATHNVVTTFESGANIVRTATGTITDQGTQLDARQNITQSATTLKEIAAEDRNWSSSSSETHDAKIGAYAGASYSGDAGAQTSVGSTGKYAEDLGGEASAGLQSKYAYDKTSQAASDTTAVTTRYKAGGSISSTTTEKTTLIGTQFEAGKDVTLNAASLDYQAARDTTSASSENRSISAEAKAKLTGTVGAEANASYEQGKSSSLSSTARAGGISAGGNVTVTTQGDARFEGTTVTSDGKAKIESTAGNVTFDAARSITHEESSGFNVSAGFGSTNQPGKEAGNEHETKTTLGGGYSTGKSDSATEAGASINARNVEISAGKDVTLRGTQVDAAENASVKAQGDVKLLEATSSSSSSSVGVSGNATAMNLTKPDGANSKAQYGSGNVNVGNEERKTGTATRITSGGDLAIKGMTLVSQQADYSAAGKLTTEGTVQNQNLTNVKKGVKVNANMSLVRKSASKAKAKAKAKPKPKAKPKVAKPGAKPLAKPGAKKTVVKTKKPLPRSTPLPAANGGQPGVTPPGAP